MSPEEIDKISINDILSTQRDRCLEGLIEMQHQYNKAILESSLMTPAEWAEKMVQRPQTFREPICRAFVPFWDIEHPDPSKLNIRVKKKRKAFNFKN